MGDCDAITLEHAVRFLQLRGGDVNGDFVGVPASQLAVFPGTTHFFGLARTDLVRDVVLTFLDAPMPEAAAEGDSPSGMSSLWSRLPLPEQHVVGLLAGLALDRLSSARLPALDHGRSALPWSPSASWSTPRRFGPVAPTISTVRPRSSGAVRTRGPGTRCTSAGR